MAARLRQAPLFWRQRKLGPNWENFPFDSSFHGHTSPNIHFFTRKVSVIFPWPDNDQTKLDDLQMEYCREHLLGTTTMHTDVHRPENTMTVKKNPSGRKQLKPSSANAFCLSTKEQLKFCSNFLNTNAHLSLVTKKEITK